MEYALNAKGPNDASAFIQRNKQQRALATKDPCVNRMVDATIAPEPAFSYYSFSMLLVGKVVDKLMINCKLIGFY